LSTLLSTGKSSRFQKAIVDEQEKAVQAASFQFPSEDPGIMVMLALAASGVSPEDVEKSMDAEIDKVVNNEISDEEFKKLISQAENDFVQQNQRMSGVLDNLATYYTFQHNANLINTELDRYKKLTKADLKRVAQKYLTKNNRVVLYFLPKSMKK
jgi:predicted Zn-dependent peptidase